MRRSSKISFLLLFVLSSPILTETKFIISLWLKQIPELTTTFTRLIIIGALISSLYYPLMAEAQATGKIKMYQTISGSVLILYLPASWFFKKNGIRLNQYII